jgi:hypothetical protein
VWAGYYQLYGRDAFSLPVIAACFLHDIGYFGKPNMDGPEKTSMTTAEIEERGQIEAAQMRFGEEVCTPGQEIAAIRRYIKDLIAAARRIEAQRDGAIQDWKGYAQQCHEARAELATVKAELAKALSVLRDAGAAITWALLRRNE